MNEEQRKQTSKTAGLGCLAVTVLVIILALFGAFENEPKTLTEKERIEQQFSAWDGSHLNLTKAIKASMNDPDSYEHVETKYWKFDGHLIVLCKFRGRNAYGGMIVDVIKAKVDTIGNVIEILE